jgi:hypothetical protein
MSMNTQYTPFFVTIVLVLSQMFVHPALAVTQATSTATLAPAARMANLKTRADLEISRRITSLQSLSAAVDAHKRLTSAQKAPLTAGISAEVTNLTTLRTKIDGDTDLTTLRPDVQMIVQSYRVYALYLPQVRLLEASDALTTADGQMSQLALKLQARIQTVQTAGNDVSAMNVSLSDLHAKLQDATTQYTAVQATVLPLTPSGYPGNKTQLISARAMIKTATTDMHSARADAKSIVTALQELKKAKTSSSSTPTK